MENNICEIDPNLLQDHSPHDIASAIFKCEPKNPCTYQILSSIEEANLIYNFEILIQILFEGMDLLTGGLDKIDINDITIEHIESFSPWISSLGFKMIVHEYDITDKAYEPEYLEYYCRGIIKNEHTNHIFRNNHVKENFHFLLNGRHFENNSKKDILKNIYLIIGNKTTIFKVMFDFYKL